MPAMILALFAGEICVLGRIRECARLLLRLGGSLLFWRASFFSGLAITFLMGVILPMPGGPGGSASNNDKLLHVAVFFALALIGVVGRYERLWLIAVLMVHGAAIEILQGFNRSRSADIYDFLADILGIMLAVGMGWVYSSGILFKRY